MNSPTVFLCHSSVDKLFARRLASDLDAQGINCWLDELEINVGEDLIEKIADGIDSSKFVVVILSPASTSSSWVAREIDAALGAEHAGRCTLLPLLLSPCEIPHAIALRRYSDFTQEGKYPAAFAELVRGLGIVFQAHAFTGERGQGNLATAIADAWSVGLFALARPFHRPFQYMGKKVADIEQSLNAVPNRAGNIIIDTDDCHMLLEAEGSFISYVSVDLKRSKPQYQNRAFNPLTALAVLSINPAELEFVRSATHYHHFSDHRRRLKVSVSCLEDGGALTVGFSSKYYGM